MNEQLPPIVIDKSDWGDGPWQTEPDRVDWVHGGFACLALRHPRHGCWCAYIGLPAGHPLYGVSPYALDTDAVPFHGGFNYGAKCEGAICHTPQPGMPDDVWWLGGDFGHLCDLSPGHRARMQTIMTAAGRPDLARPTEFEFLKEEYRDLPYVRQVVDKAADALAAMAGGGGA